MPCTSSLPSSFDRAAARYDRHADAQDRIAADLARLCAGTPAPRHVWEVGCGTGLLTRRLAALWPAAEILAQDASPAMLMEAATALPGAVRWWGADARRQIPEGSFDLLVSASALHWLGPPEQVLPRLLTRVRPGGVFAASIMISGTLAEARLAARCVRPELAFPDLPDAGDWLTALPPGFKISHARTTEVVDLHHGPRPAVRALRGQGINGAPFKPARPLTVGETRALLERWSTWRRADGRWPVTYRVLHLLAVRS